MNCIFIYNPNSGTGKILKNIDYITQRLKNKFAQVDVYQTKQPYDMQSKVTEACGVYDAVVFAGGDGSFNEVVSGLAERENRPILGYIPCGTVNDIARSLKIPRKIKKAVDVIIDGIHEEVDVIKVNDRYAMYCVCTGAFTSAAYSAPQKDKRLFGRLAYGLHGIKNNLKFEVFNVKVKCEDKIIDTPAVFTLIMNGKSVAGLNVNGKGLMNDGKLEAVIVKQSKNPRWTDRLRAFLNLIKFFILGYRSVKIKEKNIERIESSDFEIQTSDDTVWSFDGEKGTSGSLKISVISKHIQILLPKKNT